MKGTKRGKTVHVLEDASPLAQLFSGPDDSQQFDYDGVDWGAVGLLIEQSTRLGAMVSFYYSSTDNALCFSLRAGDKRRSYVAPDATILNQLAQGIGQTLAPGLRKLK